MDRKCSHCRCPDRATHLAVLAILVSAPVGVADAKGKPSSEKELNNLIAHASTKADHERLAQHLDAEAAKYAADAKDRNERAGTYQNSQAVYQNAQMFSHCDALTKSLNGAADDARALAAETQKDGQSSQELTYERKQ